MTHSILYFRRLKTAYNKSIFSESFGTYLFGLKDRDLDVLMDEALVFNPSDRGTYVLEMNDKVRSPYILNYLELILNDDKNDILVFLQEKRNDESRKFNQIVKYIVDDINIILKSLDKLKWLNHNILIETRLNEFIKEIKRDYLQLTLNMSDSDFKPLVWKGNAASLTNMFYDLMKGNTNVKEKAFISNDDKLVADFIYKAFVNEDNQPFDRGTIERGLRGKEAKRDKISLKIREG